MNNKNNSTKNILSYVNEIYIHLNDVFDMSILKKKIDNAFNQGNGKDFWQNFFACSDVHCPNKEFVYLFTEEQLHTLWEWWDKKIKQSNEETKSLLNSSRQMCFIDPVMKTGVSREKVSAYYIKFSKARDRGFEIKKVTFKPADDIQKNQKATKKGSEEGSFFKGAFAKDPKYNLTSDGDLNQKIKALLHEIRTSVVKNHHHIEKKQKNWLFYLGKKMDLSQNHTVTFCSEFCVQNDIDCPFKGLV